MKITVLGCGTSSGVPVPGCQCEVCCSNNPKNQRLRASVYIELPGQPAILIDTSTDLREQALRYSLSNLGAVLYTHAHADHVHGIDDLRSFIFVQHKPINVYATSETATELNLRFNYAFNENPAYQGGEPPRLILNTFSSNQSFSINNISITPLPALHGSLEIVGFRIGNFAYLTDCSSIPQSTIDLLGGLDLLILDGLRFRPHPTHFTIEKAVIEAETIAAKQTYLTHLSHEVDYIKGNEVIEQLSPLVNVELCFDGLMVKLT